VITLAALALALLRDRQLVAHLWLNQPNYGGETGKIAASLARGEGFRWAGPTAYEAPGIPLVLAGVFLLFGINTAPAREAMLVLNCLFSALACLIVFRIARDVFDPGIAAASAWIWALSPNAADMTQNVAGASLSALLFSLLFLLTLELDRPATLRQWLVYGVYSGIVLLFIPTALSVLPILLAWLLSRDTRGLGRRARGVCAAIVTAAIAITPWLIRNYAVFHQFVPIRSAFGLSLYWGNHPPRLSKVLPHPNSQPPEMNKLRSQGEMSYMASYEKEAVSFISQHKLAFAQATARRLAVWWIGQSWGGRLHWFRLHRLAFYPLISAFTFSGLALALRSRKARLCHF
jgi:hypothetical protein